MTLIHFLFFCVCNFFNHFNQYLNCVFFDVLVNLWLDVLISALEAAPLKYDTGGGWESVCVVMGLLCWLGCNRLGGGNIRLLSWFSDDKRGKLSMMFNQLRRGQECSPLAREQNSWHKWSLLPPFEVGPTEISSDGGSSDHRISARIPD